MRPFPFMKEHNYSGKIKNKQTAKKFHDKVQIREDNIHTCKQVLEILLQQCPNTRKDMKLIQNGP